MVLETPSAAASPSAASGAPAEIRRCCLGLFNRRERWGLSARGWLVVISFPILFTAVFLFAAHPFLAISQRVPADVLVVEGWIHEYAIRAGAAEFKSGGYRRVFTTGGPSPGLGRYVNDWQTSASVGADGLKRAGVPESVLTMVPSRVMSRDRTFSSALALRNWLREHGQDVRAFNVLTEDAHSRRTRLLFQKAFGDGVSIGVISVPSPDYDSRRWWRYSEGVREILSESIAYLYARFLFYPDAASD